MFAKATLQECSKIVNIINSYKRTFDQIFNYNKMMTISFGKGVPRATRNDIIQILGVCVCVRLKSMRNTLVFVSQQSLVSLRKCFFVCLKDRTRKKIQGRKEKLLSRPGEESLIKAVIQAIPICMMSLFSIPDYIIDDIHSILTRFWWGLNSNVKKVYWDS